MARKPDLSKTANRDAAIGCEKERSPKWPHVEKLHLKLEPTCDLLLVWIDFGGSFKIFKLVPQLSTEGKDTFPLFVIAEYDNICYLLYKLNLNLNCFIIKYHNK